MKKRNLWISVVAGMAVFGVLEVLSPYSMYIGWLWFANQLLLNAGVSALVGITLFKLLEKRSMADDFGTYLWFVVILGLGNGVFTVMYYSAWVNLGLLAAVLVKLLADVFTARFGEKADG